ncbi:MAG: thioredoxin domain-containing protein [Myxococcota bacterium]
MHSKISIGAALAATVFFCLACQPGGEGSGGGAGAPTAAPSAASPTEGGDEIAARIEGVAITVAEVDARAREDLFNARAESPAKLYELRSQTLVAMLDERTVQVAAEKRGLTPEALIDAELQAMGPVDDEEARAFFSENEARLGGVAYDEVKGQIIDFLTARRQAEAVDRVRGTATVEILMQPPRIQVAATGPSRGPESARITIVEFSDFQCPFCKRVGPTMDAIVERYPEDVRIVYRNFPLGNHNRAAPAAAAALCAEDQGKFWPYHDLLFDNPRALEDDHFAEYAAKLDLDEEAFAACYGEGRYEAQVARDLADGRAAGVTGTPAFFVNGVMLSGARPKEAFFELIDAELARN